jgi:hypothetical protein
MMGGRLCQICASAANLKVAADMIAAGASDQVIAIKIGGINRMTVSRHRRNHVEAPAKAIAEAANKGRAVVEQREALVAAAETGDATAAFIGLASIVNDLKSVRDRLERTADAAEAGGQLAVIPSTAAQQLKAAEVRARLGAVGAYAPTKAAQVNQPVFALNILFSDGHTEQVIADAVIDVPPTDQPNEAAHECSEDDPIVDAEDV